jgi:hypothetical protein
MPAMGGIAIVIPSTPAFPHVEHLPDAAMLPAILLEIDEHQVGSRRDPSKLPAK